MGQLFVLYTDMDLLLNTFKTKELVVDYRKKEGGTDMPIHINELTTTFRLLGIHISEDLTCLPHLVLAKSKAVEIDIKKKKKSSINCLNYMFLQLHILLSSTLYSSLFLTGL